VKEETPNFDFWYAVHNTTVIKAPVYGGFALIGGKLVWLPYRTGISAPFWRAANGYRLPTEAEWVYAARGGRQGRDTTYAGSNDLDAVAWYPGNSGGRTYPVGTKAANELGLHDMSGNVSEWVHDWYQFTYRGLAATDPTVPANGSARVHRGGSWGHHGACRMAYREWRGPGIAIPYIGFRVVLGPPL